MRRATRMRPSSLQLNVVANYAGKLWSIASVYIFMPMYIRMLGIDAYGLIAFNAVALALLYIADAGLSSSFAREAARGQEPQQLLDTLASAERLLLAILATIGLLFAISAEWIAKYWLNDGGHIDHQIIVRCLQMMPFALIPQIGMALYSGGLMGLQLQITANALSTTFNVFRSGFVLIPIFLYTDIRIFFAWQAIVSILFMLYMRKILIAKIVERATAKAGPSARPTAPGRFSWHSLLAIRSYAVGMLGMSIIAGLNTQLDKLVVSKMLPLGEFALYSIASTLAQIPYILALPIATALLPRYTNLVERKQSDTLSTLYSASTYCIAFVGATSGFALYFFAEDLLNLWMHGQAISGDVYVSIKLLAIGSIFLTLQLAPFQLSLANGHNATNVKLGGFILLFSIPAQIILTHSFGIIGAALPWLIMNGFAFAFLGTVLNRKFSSARIRDWFLRETLQPVAVSFLVIATVHTISARLDAGPLAKCLIAGSVSLGTLVIALHMRRHQIRSAISIA